MKSDKSNTLAFTVKLNEKTYISLDAVCLLESKKRSEMIRKFITDGIRQYLADLK